MATLMPLRRVAAWLERVNGHPVMRWFVLAAIAVPLVLSVVVSAQYFNLTSRVDRGQHQRDMLVKCIASWADQYTARAERVTDVNTDKTNAQDAYIRALTKVLDDAIRTDRAALSRDIPGYQRAARNYQDAAADLQRALAANPIPPAPKFQCR